MISRYNCNFLIENALISPTALMSIHLLHRIIFILYRDINLTAKNHGYTGLTAENWGTLGNRDGPSPHPAKVSVVLSTTHHCHHIKGPASLLCL